jgi:pSer/pThr/pTyr-binding forkhead associated (FHA) protein
MLRCAQHDRGEPLQIILEIVSGPAAGVALRLIEGEYVRVGRTDQADYLVANDGHMSRLHFLVECRPAEVRLRDLKSSNGTFVNGARVLEAEVRDGDEISAGQSIFRVRVEPAAGAGRGRRVSLTPAGADALLARLRRQFQPLYALLDAARDAKIYALLLQSSEERQSLYEGAEGDKLALFAPYLVRLPPDSALVESIVRQGWGKSWGVYLTCPEPAAEVRLHLRRFMRVKKPDGEVVHFRFYDPRVLRANLPALTEQEIETFFGPVTRFVAEDESPGIVLEFTRSKGVLQKAVSQLATAPEDQETKPCGVELPERAASAATGAGEKTAITGRTKPC